MKTPAAVFPLRAIQNLLKSIWGRWNIQAIVMGSLAFQTILVFLAPMRKRSKRNSTMLIIWSIYLLADYFATFAIGLINSSADTEAGKSQHLDFWAPFLLLHLGGPHTITSFDIEDNNLWHRHLLTLMIQVFSVLVVFYRYQSYKSDLMIPTAIIFVTGIIKYAERTRSLYLASISYMRRSMLENSAGAEGGGIELEEDATQYENKLEMIHRGYVYYNFFKGFIVDHTFIHIEGKLDNVKKFFSKLDHRQAFELLEMELNFMYDAMFTKMAAVQWMSSIGYAYRFASHALLLSVAMTFFFGSKPHISPDISITYILLGGAIVLDFIALTKLVFSEWTVAIMMDEEYKAHAQALHNHTEEKGWISRVKRSRRIIKIINVVNQWISSNQRWSREIRQYSLMNHSLKRRLQWVDVVLNYLGLTERIDAVMYTSIEPITCNLRELVFQDIKKKGELQQAKEIKDVPAGGGGGSHSSHICSRLRKLGNLPSMTEYHNEYDNSVLIWHVATEICYFSIFSEEGDPNPKICRNISEYLVYLMVMEGKITSTVPGNIGMRFRDICWEEVRDTLEELKIRLPRGFRRQALLEHIKFLAFAKLQDVKDVLTPSNWRKKNAEATCSRKRTRWEQHIRSWENEQREEACRWLLRDIIDEDSCSHGSKSILFEAVELAKHLNSCLCNNNNHHHHHQHQNIPDNLEPADVENPDDDGCCSEKELWEIMSHVWVGLLSYAASHCREDVQYLNKGGELLTFVRLLMVHFGLREKFKDEHGFKLEEEIN